MRVRTLPITLAFTLITGALLAPSAQAVPVDEFDAPLLGTSATAQLQRMPTLAQVQCSDAECTSGLFPAAALSLVEYSTPEIMPDAGYTRVPEFRRGVNALWRDLTVRQGDVSFATFTIAEYAPEADMKKIMDSIAAQTKTPLTESVVQGMTVYSGEIVNASDDENDFSGTSFKSAYVLGANSFVRAGCQAGDSGLQTSRCTIANLIPLAISIAQAQPKTPLPQRAALKRLQPASLPSELQPLVVGSVGDDQPWAIDVSNKKLLDALNGQPTAMAQYSLKGSPRMYVMTLSTKLTKPSAARGFINRPCVSTDEEVSCVDRTLPGGAGKVTTFKAVSEGGSVPQVSVEGIAGNTLLSFTCFKREAVSGYLTKREIAQCTSLGSSMINQVKN